MSQVDYHDFSLTPPEGWEDRSTILWIEPVMFEPTPTLKQQKLPRANFVIERQILDDDVEEPISYLTERLGPLRENLPHFKLVGNVKSYTQGDLEGAETTYTFMVEQLPVQQKHVVLFYEDFAFHLIATATTSRFTTLGKRFDELFKSFKINT